NRRINDMIANAYATPALNAKMSEMYQAVRQKLYAEGLVGGDPKHYAELEKRFKEEFVAALADTQIPFDLALADRTSKLKAAAEKLKTVEKAKEVAAVLAPGVLSQMAPILSLGLQLAGVGVKPGETPGGIPGTTPGEAIPDVPLRGK